MSESYPECCPANLKKSNPCDTAAYWRNLCCLKYARDHGCVWTNTVWVEACRNADFFILQYALDNACPIDVETFQVKCCRNVETLKFMRLTVGCKSWDKETCSAFAENGKLDCLRYAHENGCLWDDRTTTAAAAHGYLECLRYAFTKGCPIDVSFCRKLIESRQSNSIECLQFGIDNGASTDDPALMLAAARHHNSVFLIYLHQRGLLITADAVLETVKNARLDSFIYCMQQKIPFNLNLCLLVSESMSESNFHNHIHRSIFAYLVRLERAGKCCFAKCQHVDSLLPSKP
jgi:hypothetical protein